VLRRVRGGGSLTHGVQTFDRLNADVGMEEEEEGKERAVEFDSSDGRASRAL
jgi:hypothetical protein